MFGGWLLGRVVVYLESDCSSGFGGWCWVGWSYIGSQTVVGRGEECPHI